VSPLPTQHNSYYHSCPQLQPKSNLHSTLCSSPSGFLNLGLEKSEHWTLAYHKLTQVWCKIYIYIYIYWIQVIISTLTFNRPVHIMCTYLPCKAGGKYTVVVSASQATAGMDGQPIWPCCMTVGHKAWFKKCMLMWVAGTGWPAGIMQSFQIGSLWISWPDPMVHQLTGYPQHCENS